MVDYRNIEKDTIKNKLYRKVVFTVPGKTQLVLMSLKPGEDIPMEIHKYITQFIRVEKGRGFCIVSGKKYTLKDGISITIPNNKKHYIKNTSKTQDLKMYILYSPEEHPRDKINKRQPENDHH